MSGPDVLLVSPALAGLPGQERYVSELRRHLPGTGHVALRKPGWATGATTRTLAAWASYPAVRRPEAGTVVHGTDTFCAVRGVDVVTVHDLVPLLVSREWTARAPLALFGRRLRHAHVITLTQAWAGRIGRELGLAADRIHVVPNGCEAGPAAQGTLPGHLAGRRHVLVVGAYRPYKRLREAIAAVAALPGTRLVHVGPLDGSPYERECHRVARRLGCDLVEAGQLPDPWLQAWYAAADLLVYGSVDEGFGLPPLEAMAHGTTSLVSDIAVFRELYGDHVLYQDATRPLAGQLRAALDTPLPRPRLRAHAARFRWEATARRTAAVHRVAAEAR